MEIVALPYSCSASLKLSYLFFFSECVLKRDKIKVLPAIGKIFERYGPLSMIFYKEGHFKSNFLYFDKKTPPFPEGEK